MLIIWTTGLLFSMTSLGDACVVAIVGESAVLPCTYNGTQGLDCGSISVEWRTGSELVHRAVLGKEREAAQSASRQNRMRLVTDTMEGGDVSLLISDVMVGDAQSYDCYLTLSGAQPGAPLCTVCLSAAAHFSHPVVLGMGEAMGEEAHFICHSRGGFPEPTVHWFIDDTEHHLVGTVRTYSSLLPHSELYNITSILAINLTHDMTVSCAIENRLLNETLTSIDFGVKASPMVGRASEAMWMFSTALCVLVGVLVVAAVAFQIKQDYKNKKNRQQQEQQQQKHPEIRGKERRDGAERERMILEHLNSLIETTV